MQSAMERRQRIVEILNMRRFERLENLASELNVSKMTIRRDIEVLSCSYPIDTKQGNGGCIYVQDGFDLYERINGREQYVDTFIPKGDITDTIDTFINVGYSDKEREFVINFPLYSEVKALYIGLKDSATVSAPTPYKYGKPIVYYGSSITQGACASRAGTSYQGFISRRLDADFINLGFLYLVVFYFGYLTIA